MAGFKDGSNNDQVPSPGGGKVWMRWNRYGSYQYNIFLLLPAAGEEEKDG